MQCVCTCRLNGGWLGMVVDSDYTGAQYSLTWLWQTGQTGRPQSPFHWEWIWTTCPETEAIGNYDNHTRVIINSTVHGKLDTAHSQQAVTVHSWAIKMVGHSDLFGPWLHWHATQLCISVDYSLGGLAVATCTRRAQLLTSKLLLVQSTPAVRFISMIVKFSPAVPLVTTRKLGVDAVNKKLGKYSQGSICTIIITWLGIHVGTVTY